MKRLEEKLNDVSLMALNKWGIEEQKDQFYEEIGELMAAINQHKRGRIPVSKVREELADVECVLHQLKIYYGKAETERWKETKLDRTERRINEEM